MLPNGDRLLTIKEACKVLNCSRSLIWRLRATGQLPYIQLNGGVRIRESDLMRLIERNYVSGNQQVV